MKTDTATALANERINAETTYKSHILGEASKAKSPSLKQFKPANLLLVVEGKNIEASIE